jgi:serine protease inhibitor
MVYIMNLVRVLSIGAAVLLPLLPLVKASLLSKQHVFADNLAEQLHQADNECTSALGVSMALSLLYPSSSGSSREQMQAVMGYPSTESPLQLVWNETQQRVETKHDGECVTYANERSVPHCLVRDHFVKMATRIWMADSRIVNDDLASFLGPYLFLFDFNAGDAGSIINEWVSALTKGLVESIVDDGALPQYQYQLIAVNTIAIKAEWEDTFTRTLTSLDSFYTSSSRLTALPNQAHFMHKVETNLYSHTAIPGFQLLRLPFRGSLSILLVLPSSEDLAPVGSQAVWEAVPKLVPERVAIALPKFRFESLHGGNLKRALQAINLTSPFEEGLCFSGEGGCHTHLSSVIQKTVISVTEDGVEAGVGATTAQSRSATEPQAPVLFLADHPFQFFIIEEDEELVLFEGRVGDPGVIDGEETPPLDAQHSDSDFWKTHLNEEPRGPSSSYQLSPAWLSTLTVSLVWSVYAMA